MKKRNKLPIIILASLLLLISGIITRKTEIKAACSGTSVTCDNYTYVCDPPGCIEGIDDPCTCENQCPYGESAGSIGCNTAASQWACENPCLAAGYDCEGGGARWCTWTGSTPTPTPVPPPDCSGVCCATGQCQGQIDDNGACQAANPDTPLCCNSCSSGGGTTWPPYANYKIWFYYDLNRNGQWDPDSEQTSLPGEVINNIKIDVICNGNDCTSESFTGIPNQESSTWNRVWAHKTPDPNDTSTCWQCDIFCCDFGSTAGYCIVNTTDEHNVICESQLNSGFLNTTSPNFPSNQTFSSYIRIGPNGDYYSFSRPYTFAFTPPSNWQLTSIRWDSTDTGNRTDSGYTTANSFSTTLNCIACSDTQYHFVTRLIKVGLAPRQHPPQAISSEIIDPDSDNDPSQETVIRQTNTVLTFKTIFYDQDDPPADLNLVTNGNFESGSGSNITGWTAGGDISANLTNTTSAFNSQSVRLRRTGGNDAYLVSDWIDFGQNLANQTLTLSFWAKLSSGSQTIEGIGLQSYPEGGDWGNARALWVSPQINNNWQHYRYSLTFPSDTPSSQFRVVLRPPTNTSPSLYYDGVMVESGTTQGIFSDLYRIQLNIERDDNDAEYNEPNGTGNAWPIRLMFDRRIESPSQRDSYWFAVGGSGGWTQVSARHDSNSNRWYLPNDTTISRDSTPYFTVLGGSNNTYFYLSDHSLVAYWKVRLESGFPNDQYNTTLYVSDLSQPNNLEDETADSGDTLLEVNSPWAGPAPDNAFDFHRFGQNNLVLITSDVQVSGTIYDVTSTYPNSTCDDFATAPRLANQTITFTNLGDSSQVSTTTDANGNYSLTLTYNQTYQIQPITNYFHVISDFTNLPSIGTCVTDDTFQVESAPTITGLDFGFSQTLDPWAQVIGGDVISFGPIQVAVPESCRTDYNNGGECLPFLATNRLTNSSGPLFSENGIVATQTTGGIDQGQALAVGEPQNWQVEDTQLWRPSTSRGYDYYQRLFWDQTDIQLSGNQTLSGITELADGQVNNGETVMRLIDGHLTIDRNLSVAQGGLALLIVSGNITINGNVTQLEGIFMADGNITIQDGSNDNLNDQLTVAGSLVADADNQGNGSLTNQRDLGADNNLNPAVVFRFRPDLIVTMLAEGVGVKPWKNWQEVKP